MPPDGEKKTPEIKLEDLNKQKQDLEKQINDLKGQVLDKKEEQDKLVELEKEKKKVEDEILKYNQDQEKDLEKDVGVPGQTYEIIKGTEMYKKLLVVLKTEVEVKNFADQIDNTVKSYLNQAFKESSESTNILLSQEVIGSMNIGIQFAMMEALTSSGNKGADFFNGFAKVDTGDGKSAFTGLFELFSKFSNKVGGGGKFLALAKRVQNCTEFIKKQIKKEPEYGDGSKSKQLNNANEFRKLLSNTTRDNYEGLRTKTFKDMGITVSEQELTQAEKMDGIQDLQKIANNPDMPINEKTIESIKKALPNAQKFLEKRGEYKNKAVEIMDKVGSILDINLFGLGTIGALLGINSPADLLGKKGKKKGIIDFVLRIMGFSGGVEGLHREYIYQNIEKNLHEHPDKDNKKKFIKDTLTDYKSGISTSYSGTDTITKFSLSDYDSALKPKIPTQYDTIKNSILKSISGKEFSLNPNVLQSLGLNVPTKIIKDKDNKDMSVIDETKFDKSLINESFVTTYLDKQIPYLVSNKDFMTEIKDSDQFVLAVTGNLVADKYFVEGVLLGLETTGTYITVTPPASSTETTTDKPEIYKGEVTNQTTDYPKLVDVVIDKLEGGYYNPDMKISGMGSSGETMMGIDRKNGGALNTSEAGKEFRKLIDDDKTKNPDKRVHNYRGGNLEPRLRILAGEIIKPHYENLSKTYLSSKALELVNTDGRLLFNFIYGAWNGEGRFKEMANIINADVQIGITDPDKLLKDVVDFRKNNSNSLIAQGGQKISDIVGVA